MQKQKRSKRYRGNGSSNSVKKLKKFPEDAIENILTFLPIKEAVSHGVLSRRFKNSWRSSRNLSFDVDFAAGRSREDFAKTVNHVFDRHDSSSKIQRFQLYFDATGADDLLTNWVKRAIEKGVEEMDLDFTPSERTHLLSHNFFSVDSNIRVLKLASCSIGPLPLPHFKGLSFLKTLVLRTVLASSIFMSSIFSCCLFLEELELEQCYAVFCLDIFTQKLKWFKKLVIRECHEIAFLYIDSPTLRSLHFHGDYGTIDFYKALPRLIDATIDFVPTTGLPPFHKIPNLFMALSYVQDLTLNSTFLEELFPKHGLHTFVLVNVKEFHLKIEGFSSINPYDIACFLMKCPYVESVFLDLGEFPLPRVYHWGMNEKLEFESCDPLFLQLSFVKVMGFKFYDFELKMVKFFLSKAMFLQTLTLTPSENNRPIFLEIAERFEKHYFILWKGLSSSAKIVYDLSF